MPPNVVWIILPAEMTLDALAKFSK